MKHNRRNAYQELYDVQVELLLEEFKPQEVDKKKQKVAADEEQKKTCGAKKKQEAIKCASRQSCCVESGLDLLAVNLTLLVRPVDQSIVVLHLWLFLQLCPSS